MMKAILLNGSPRKNFSTAQLLQQAQLGAEAAGAETELIHLVDYEFTDCRECYACKLKNSKTGGVCAVRD
ncbi:MAG: NAD(P)H-dependent oxidoreductase, partial [Caecibacter massiliensis]|nr:NAD(P)H-dependent oxidoreductase [Caecibacter massiliensis]